MTLHREAHIQAALEQELQLRGWRYFHCHDSRRSVAGFPDLLCIRGQRLFVAEIKTATGRVSREQRAWLDAFELAGVEAQLWRLPGDWVRVGAVLR